ncbi:MAG: trypsin-like peptidase domain-containing protein [Verrucomicrobia bacterium]|nr:trypsin-like peptidase domain-containing protein [Verrucomicrobiota bacterium]
MSTDRRGKPKSFGAGFFISGDGLIVTARHVAQAEDNLLAITHDGAKHPITGFLGEDRDYDVAVVKLDGRGFAPLPLADALPKTNEWVALVSPTDQWAALFDRTDAPAPVCVGRIESVLSLPGLWTTLHTTVPAQHGQSGSPLLNERFEVIGVMPFLSDQEQATVSPMTVVQQLVAKARTGAPIAFAKRPRKGGSAPLLLDADFKAGAEAMKRQDWNEVERRMKRAAKSFRESPLPLTCLASTYAKRGAWKETHAACEKALRLSQGSALLQVLDGTSLVMLGRNADGLASVRSGLDLGLPDPAMRRSAWTLLATAEAALGHANRVREALENLRSLDTAEASQVAERIRQINPKLNLSHETNSK